MTPQNSEQYREKIDKWLGAPDPSLDHNNACEKRQRTTGAWVIEGIVILTGS